MMVCHLVSALLLSAVCLVPCVCIFVLFVGFLLKMVPKHSAEVLPSIPKFKKLAVCLIEKIHVLDTLHSDMSYSAAGCE